MEKRDKAIWTEYNRNVSAKKLAKKYKLSESSIQRIVRNY